MKRLFTHDNIPIGTKNTEPQSSFEKWFFFSFFFCCVIVMCFDDINNNHYLTATHSPSTQIVLNRVDVDVLCVVVDFGHFRI